VAQGNNKTMDKQTQKNLLELVKRSYEEIAEEFNESRKKHLQPLWGKLIDIAKKVKNNDKILDVGCGNGRLLEIFNDKEIIYIGVDYNEKLIDYAKNRQSAVKNRKFIFGDILELGKIPEINFDYIFCIAVLHHLPGNDLRIAALKQLKNKLISNGKIIISVWNLWSQKKFRKLIFKFALLKLIKKNKMDLGDILFEGFSQKSKRYYHAFTKRGLKKLVKKSGLKLEKIYKDKFNYYAILEK